MFFLLSAIPFFFCFLASVIGGVKSISCRESIEKIVSSNFNTTLETMPSDLFEKADSLLSIDLQGIGPDQILGAGYIRDIDDRYKALETLGLSKAKINFLENMGLFDIDPYNYRYLTTLLPMKKSHISRGVKVSLLGENGYLENATVTQVLGERVEASLDSNPTKILSVPGNKVFRPIRANKEILYRGEDAIPLIAKIVDVAKDGSVSLDVLPEGKRIFGEELKLTPREWTKTGGKDFSVQLSEEEIIKYSESYQKLKNIYKREGETESFVGKNYIFMKQTRHILHKQGVFSSFFWNERGTLSLMFNGVHEQGNRTAKKYMRMLEEQGYLKATFSVIDNLKRNTAGFYDEQDSRIEFGLGIIYNIFIKNNFFTLPHHEIRHMMRRSMQESFRGTLFDYLFQSNVYRGRDLYNRSKIINIFFKRKRFDYDYFMSFDEIYVYISDIFNMVKILHSHLHSIPLGNKEVFLRDLHVKFEVTREISINANNILEGLLSRPLDIVKVEDSQGKFYLGVRDSKQRVIFARFSEETKQRIIANKKVPGYLKDEIRDNLTRMSQLSSKVLKILEDIAKTTAQGEDETILPKARELLMLVRRENKLGRRIL